MTDMTFSFCKGESYRGVMVGTSGTSWLISVTETSGRPTSRDFLEQAMQGGLVGYEAGNDGRAVDLVAEAQSVKPGGPSRVEVSLETDFIPSGLVMTAGRYLVHGPPSASRTGLISASASAFVGLDRKVEGDVVSGHHHMW
jgi:hypothetical protein